ncbi:MAG: hypothetical protein ACPG1C_10810 [Alphaproteobacteria bacterium]
MKLTTRIVGLVVLAVAFSCLPGLASAQPAVPEYDLESLGEEMGEPTGSELCQQFTAELQRLAGCDEVVDEDETGEDDPSLEGVEAAEIDDSGAGNSPFSPIDPTQDMINGLPGGGGGFDPFGQAIDDLTGGLFLGDQP